MSKQTFRLRNNFILNILFTFSSFALALFGLLVLLPPAETEIATAVIDGTAYSLSVTTGNSINLELTPTTNGSMAIAKNTITATTTSPSGYKLYISTNSTSNNNIYLNGNSSNNSNNKTIKSTTGTFNAPVALNVNNNNGTYATWGYAVAGLNNFDSSYSTTNPSTSSKFAALPTKNNEQLIRDHTGTASNNTTNVYYGFKVNNNLVSGDYQTEILYTTLTDVSNVVNGEATITPNELEEGYEAQTATITTSLKTTRELGAITATINNQSCTSVTVTSENPVTITCSIPTNLAAGNYDVVINFNRLGKSYTITNGVTVVLPQLTCNPSATTIAGAVCMQDMNEDVIASMVLEQQYQLIDNRDEKTYFIAKLQDGKVWMTQNLDLNLSSSTTLTNENTDLNSVSSWTPTRSTIDVTSNKTTTGTSGTITGWTNDYDTPYSVDPGNVYFDDTYFTSSSCYYLTTSCEHFKNTKYTLNNEHGHVGNYYNWSAVVASNNTSSYTTNGVDYPDSICPKGWRLPYGEGSSSGNDFATLKTAYGNPSSDQTLLGNPLFFVRAGYVYTSSLGAAAHSGLYWSSTVHSSYVAHHLYFASDRVDPSSSDRGRGFPARCVAREPEPEPELQTLADITYMQEITSDICATTPTPTVSDGDNTPQYQLIDNRDNKTYWVAKLADGKCWMTQNLDLNLSTSTTLTNENTDLNSVSSWTPARSTIDATSNKTTTGTAASITGWTNDAYTPYSLDPGNVYFDGTSFESTDCDYFTTNCPHYKNTKQTLNNEHGHVGNYYNWSAAVASNNTSSFTTENADYENSICPKGWKLPRIIIGSNDFSTLIGPYYDANHQSLATIRYTPLFFTVAGSILGNSSHTTYSGSYWSSTVRSSQYASELTFDSDHTNYYSSGMRSWGLSVRCVAR